MLGEQIHLRSQKGSAVKKTECSVGAPQGHRLHQCAEIRRLQITLKIADDKALLLTSDDIKTERQLFLSVSRGFEFTCAAFFLRLRLWLFLYWYVAQQQCDSSCQTPPELARTNIFPFSFTKCWYIIQRDRRLCPRWFSPTPLILQIYRRLAPTVNSLMHVSFPSHVSSSLAPSISSDWSFSLNLYTAPSLSSCSVTLADRCVTLCGQMNLQELIKRPTVHSEPSISYLYMHE